ncbi:hypothetical protein [Paenibacillus mesotrionivorans]|uniref:Uncharacterized protein n=1 Tax=Paenibacillus mesotrionivorans TaxID=3160968 RepID=A0ACC7P2Y1_9BACL
MDEGAEPQETAVASRGASRRHLVELRQIEVVILIITVQFIRFLLDDTVSTFVAN